MIQNTRRLAIPAHFHLPCKLSTSRSRVAVCSHPFSTVPHASPTFEHDAKIVAIYILCKCLCPVSVCLCLRAEDIFSHLTVGEEKNRAVVARPTPPLIFNRQFSLFGSDFFFGLPRCQSDLAFDDFALSQQLMDTLAVRFLVVHFKLHS